MRDDKLVKLTEEDEFGAKIICLREENKKSEMVLEIDRLARSYFSHLFDLAPGFLDVSTGQLEKLNSNDMERVGEIVAKKAKPWAIVSIASTVILPLSALSFGGLTIAAILAKDFLAIAWFLCFSFSTVFSFVVPNIAESLHYLHYYSAFKKKSGNEFKKNFSKKLAQVLQVLKEEYKRHR